MKKIMYLAFATLMVVSCQQEPKDYVVFSGKITNPSSDSLVIFSRADRNFKKKIAVDADGNFNDTLKVADGEHSFYDGTQGTYLYLKNGFELNVTLDAKEFGKTTVFTGNGSEANNFLSQKIADQQAMFSDESMFTLSKEDFAAKLETIESDFIKSLEELKNVDSAFIANEKKGFDGLKKYLVNYHEEKLFLSTVLGKGKESPKFVKYENNAGGTTSLDDLKGKYTYIDVWATWCGPCKVEIPYLKEIEKAYHGKKINFVSLSIDEPRDYDKWKSMIKDKELGGIQLLADKAWKSQFVQDYKINGIPRFILIDPKGNIVTADAPRPSNDKLKELLNSLDI
ncbi:MAG: TlpA family protein disulfide reductase [Flavobacteriaceae bacterium]